MVAVGPSAAGLHQAVLHIHGLSVHRAEIDNHVHSFRHADFRRCDLDRVPQEIAVIRDVPELLGLGRVEPRDKDLIETRRAAVQPAEAVLAGTNVEHRLDLAVDKELISQDAVKVEQVEKQLVIHCIEALVGKHHGNVKLATRKTEPGWVVFVVIVLVVEQGIHPCQSLVDILSGKIHAMVVVPQSAHRLVRIPVGRMGRGKSGKDFGLVVVIEEGIGNCGDLRVGKVIARESVTFRGRMPVMQVCCYLPIAKPIRERREW